MRDIGVLVVERLFQDGQRPFQAIDQLNTSRQVKEHDGVGRPAKGLPKATHIVVGISGTGRFPDVDASQAVGPDQLPFIAGLPRVTVIGVFKGEVIAKITWVEAVTYVTLRVHHSDHVAVIVVAAAADSSDVVGR